VLYVVHVGQLSTSVAFYVTSIIDLGIRCAGLHRKLGTHISKIKSASLDTWHPEHLSMCSSMGNQKVNEKYLSRGNAPVPNSGSDA
jgi:Putative GTPase activating protein for Arf